jgi:lactoylglutathione lyase
MSITSIAHVCLRTTDLDRTRDFYCVGLGLKPAFSFTRKGEIIGFYLRINDRNFIEVFKADKTEGSRPVNSLAHFCLETDDIEGMRRNLAERGYAPGEVKMGGDHSLQFWVVDPNGISFEFHQYTDQSAQKTGQDVELG